MKIYIDKDFKCHATEVDSLRAVETETFDGKCAKYIEGYRFVPEGETWTREDGEIFHGEMIAPWRDYDMLCEFQKQYEELTAQQADMRAALAVLGVSESEA